MGRAATLEAARAAEKAFETSQGRDKVADDAANVEAELQAGAAQSAAIDLSLRAISDVFNALGPRPPMSRWRSTATGAPPAPPPATTR